MRAVALLPAAGVGSRFGADVPKQYVRLAGKTVLEHTVDVLLADERIAAVAVVVSPDDAFAATLPLPDRVRCYAVGGSSRAESVRNGLAALLADGTAAADTPVLVHDAARCCLPPDALARLLAHADAPHGALLAVPLADTLKRADARGDIETTVPRERLWQAQTPQLFQAALLQRALSGGLDGITDEASAVERLGLRPRLVMGDSRNIKLTRPEDADLARALLGN
ncbi:2-C-methyl-D-erythritol 4-phosphate cytidylyltransferase [Conchiformibius kuhniae]|uniref:2-C-methyl-D-erythritol 4-phosphate cytidylyltransferase n=1 Tax=Conchiformibius kuhniae TaxID=211502 RepID=A0ABD8B6T2_9NEIS|nr:2-C-methyl-D-erythritol 4-phosphate cytidylyltransferase [Conchiformibius kuhniae]